MREHSRSVDHERRISAVVEAIVRQGTKRCDRGINLYWQHRDSIERTGPSSYLDPSCSSNEMYRVDLELQYCSCPDHQKAKELGVRCKHLVAATIYRAKGRAARKR